MLSLKCPECGDCFNPPPVRKPEETTGLLTEFGRIHVSIRPQFANRRKPARRRSPRPRACCFNPPPVRKPEETSAGRRTPNGCRVSIRPQFANRRKRALIKRLCAGTFQSAPSSQTGGNTSGSVCSTTRPKFQSAPSSQTGGNPLGGRPHEAGEEVVSIRPQFANRRKRLTGSLELYDERGFNPPPVRKPEETTRAGPRPEPRHSFNPPPVRKPEETAARPAPPPRQEQFQSAPSSQTGGNRNAM